MPNDKDLQKQIEHDKIANKLGSCNYKTFVSDLINKGESSPFGHYVEIEKTDEYHVYIVLQNSDESIESYYYTVDEFEDVLMKLRDYRIKDYPEEKENYIELTRQLIDKLRR